MSYYNKLSLKYKITLIVNTYLNVINYIEKKDTSGGYILARDNKIYLHDMCFLRSHEIILKLHICENMIESIVENAREQIGIYLKDNNYHHTYEMIEHYIHKCTIDEDIEHLLVNAEKKEGE